MKNHFDSIDQVNNLREIQVQHGAARSQRAAIAELLGTGGNPHFRSFRIISDQYRVPIIGSLACPLVGPFFIFFHWLYSGGVAG